MMLPAPSAAYDQADQGKTRDALRRADAENLKRGRDVELGKGRLIITDEETGARYALRIAGGVPSWTAL